MNKVIHALYVFGVIILLASCGNSGKKTNEKITPKNPILIKTIKPTVNVYIENSGSMDGYVKGVTGFEQAVYSYLSTINRRDLTDSMNLNYINSAILFQNPDVEDFIEKLEPTTFKQKGGNRTYTEISDIIDTILKETNENTISVLVTDGVFSLGGNIDSREYLINQQIGISNDVTEFLKKHSNMAIVVYQLSSNFDGQYFYFDKNLGREIGKHIIDNRPYYIWLIGDIENVSKFYKEIPDHKIVGSGVENNFSIISEQLFINYAVHENSGNFIISLDNPKTEIKKLGKDKISKKVQFSVNVDFSKMLLNNEYLFDTSNYEVTGSYKITVTKAPQNNHNYTHSINFTSDRVHKGEIVVKLKKQMPRWVEEKNDNDGYSYVKDKTFGIFSQLKGVFDAFTDRSKYYTEIKVNIN